MTEFEQQVTGYLADHGERLARIEAKLENGISKSVRGVEDWIAGHPVQCPIKARRTIYSQPVIIAVLAAGGVKLLDALPAIVRLIGGAP
jgi:hypothetical protein